MANEKISAMGSVTNSGTLQVPAIDPNDLSSNKRTTLPSLIVTDNVHTVTNASTIITSGGTVAGSGGVATITGFGGGGGSLADGLGIHIVTNSGTSTINNTGTIVQPASTSASSAGVTLQSGGITAAGTAAPLYAGNQLFKGGYVTITDPAGAGASSGMVFEPGAVYAGTIAAYSAELVIGRAEFLSGSLASGGFHLLAGSVNNGGSAARSGGVRLTTGALQGDATLGTAGDITIETNYGSAYAGAGGNNLNIVGLRTIDPGTVAAPNGIWADNGVLVQSGHTAGGGGISGLTTTVVPKATSATTIGDSAFIDSSGTIGITAELSASVGLSDGGPGLQISDPANFGFFGLAIVPTGTTDSQTYLELDAFGSGGPEFDFVSARGHSGALASVLNNYTLGQFTFQGYTGSGFVPGAFIIVTATEDWTPSARGNKFVFINTLAGGTSGNSALILQSNGDVDFSQGAGRIVQGTGTTTASAGAATVNAMAGTVTSEALVAATTYTLTLTNQFISATSVVLVNATDSATLGVTLKSVTPGSGSVVIAVSMAALTGTVTITFGVFN